MHIQTGVLMKQVLQIVIIFGLSLYMTYADVVPVVKSDTQTVWTIKEKKLPLPSCASKEIQNVLSTLNQPNVEARRNFKPKSKEEWLEWIDYSREIGTEGAKEWAKKYHVSIKQERINGVNVYRLIPDSLSKENREKLFIYLHGGAYLFGGGMSALNEAILIAHRVQIPVLAVDYRMPPDAPYPAALNDVVAVYSTLIQFHPATTMAMGGSSSGGGLVLASIQKLKRLHIILPAALFVGTPWSDLSKNGDSLYVNEGIDRKIVTYDGFLPEAVKLYANGHDIKESGLSPIYGDFSNFPPTMFVTGTRDLFLSMTVRVHRKLKEAGIEADLNVYEGLSHVEYFIVPDAPESLEVYKELKIFLEKYLLKKR